MSGDCEKGGDEMDPVIRLSQGLRNAQASAEVQRRIVEGTLERLERPRPLLQPRLILAVAGGAAVLILVLLLSARQSTRPAQPASSRGEALLARETHATPQEMSLGSHRVQLAANTKVVVTQSDPTRAELVLERGKASFAVTPLQRGGRFRVRAGGLLVEVIGTRFSVEATGVCTEVAVSQGKVSVADGEKAVYLAAGDARLFCREQVSSAPLPGEAGIRQALALTRDGEFARAVELLEEYRRQQPGGVFEEEVLFYLCLAQARLGHRQEARQLLDQFLTRFPGSRRAERLQQLVGVEKP